MSRLFEPRPLRERMLDARGRKGQFCELVDPYRFGASGPADPDFANVSYLCHFDNAGGNPIDQSVNGFTPDSNSLDISAAQSVFGGASGHADGSSGYFSYLHNAAFDLTTGDWTIELWIRLHSLAANQQIICKQTSTGFWPYNLTYVTSGGKLLFRCFDNAGPTLVANITGTTTLLVDTWYFVSMTRSGSTFDLSLGGASEGTATSSATLYTASDSLFIMGSGAGTAVVNGYIDDLRITKGVVRSSAVPIAPFPNH